ncbi:MAG: CBS domain-containing protein [Nitrososphaerota archaeon]|nr:CBS domain-containing protein [Nitrososphaerota archaeon]
MAVKESLEAPVLSFMTKGFAKVDVDDSIFQAAEAMARLGATEAIVTRGGSPAGIITERDILYKVVAAGLSPQQAKARDVMSAPLQTIDESAKAAEAIAKMSKLGIRRLVVTSKGEPVGMVTQKAVVAGPRGEHVVLPELASPTSFSCPYCDATMKTREELSKHIDQVHLGPGLLEGDRSKW